MGQGTHNHTFGRSPFFGIKHRAFLSCESALSLVCTCQHYGLWCCKCLERELQHWGCWVLQRSGLRIAFWSEPLLVGKGCRIFALWYFTFRASGSAQMIAPC